jgi:hypothetical protein
VHMVFAPCRRGGAEASHQPRPLGSGSKRLAGAWARLARCARMPAVLPSLKVGVWALLHMPIAVTLATRSLHAMPAAEHSCAQ